MPNNSPSQHATTNQVAAAQVQDAQNQGVDVLINQHHKEEADAHRRPTTPPTNSPAQRERRESIASRASGRMANQREKKNLTPIVGSEGAHDIPPQIKGWAGSTDMPGPIEGPATLPLHPLQPIRAGSRIPTSRIHLTIKYYQGATSPQGSVSKIPSRSTHRAAAVQSAPHGLPTHHQPYPQSPKKDGEENDSNTLSYSSESPLIQHPNPALHERKDMTRSSPSPTAHRNPKNTSQPPRVINVGDNGHQLREALSDIHRDHHSISDAASIRSHRMPRSTASVAAYRDLVRHVCEMQQTNALQLQQLQPYHARHLAKLPPAFCNMMEHGITRVQTTIIPQLQSRPVLSGEASSTSTIPRQHALPHHNQQDHEATLIDHHPDQPASQKLPGPKQDLHPQLKPIEETPADQTLNNTAIFNGTHHS